MEISDKGLENLRCAIVEQMAKDYLDFNKRIFVLEHGVKTPRSYDYRKRDSIEVLKKELNLTINFFHSQWYTELCSKDPNYFLEQLDTQLEEWKKEYLKKLNSRN